MSAPFHAHAEIIEEIGVGIFEAVLKRLPNNIVDLAASNGKDDKDWVIGIIQSRYYSNARSLNKDLVMGYIFDPTHDEIVANLPEGSKLELFEKGKVLTVRNVLITFKGSGINSNGITFAERKGHERAYASFIPLKYLQFAAFETANGLFRLHKLSVAHQSAVKHEFVVNRFIKVMAEGHVHVEGTLVVKQFINGDSYEVLAHDLEFDLVDILTDRQRRAAL